MEKGDDKGRERETNGETGLNGRSRKRKLPSVVRTGCNRYRVMRSRGLSAGKHVYILYYRRYMFRTCMRIRTQIIYSSRYELNTLEGAKRENKGIEIEGDAMVSTDYLISLFRYLNAC